MTTAYETHMHEKKKDREGLEKFFKSVEAHFLLHPVAYAELLKSPSDVLDRIEMGTLSEFGMEMTFARHRAIVSTQVGNREAVYLVGVGSPEPVKRLRLWIFANRVISLQQMTVEELGAWILKQPGVYEKKPPEPKQKFHVCQCDPPPEPCMCKYCHTCKGVKPEYAKEFREDTEQYEEQEAPHAA